MGIFDRVILTIYTFVLAFLSLGVVLMGLRLIPLELVWTTLYYIYGQWEAALAGALFLLISVRLLLAGSRSRTAKDTLVHHNPMGDVHISIDAIENLVSKAVRHAKGVRGVKVVVGQSAQGLTVDVKAIVSPESNVPAVTAEVQQRIHEHIKHTIGVEIADVRILVENISNDFKTKHRVE
ncbi:alkaline shock response membrane anchor protein AmaP [Anaerospora sp.]|uniref:alkaline shock response membrane anchor protein AmaP n=1 Tax=Anaerospora sp. TaxID=1960278 RepID=UPI002898A1A8|nr:alkaline shock response membrane anchor protein AmaP [Anaerospora sp.]